MFENESIGYATKLINNFCIQLLGVTQLRTEKNYETVEGAPHFYHRSLAKAFKDGAEFGYKYKENEWHYVKDELPPEDVPLLCVKGGSVYVAWYWDNIYHNARCRQVKKPYAWKEIELPKESV